MADSCAFGGVTKPNGNCAVPGGDGLAVQCVGPWSQDKHDYLDRYLEASGNPRRKYLSPVGDGGAAFVDLFAGPGRGRVRTTGEQVDGSPLVALKQASPFSTVVLCELDAENVEALERRVAGYHESVIVKVIRGDSNETIIQAANAIPPLGLNVAWVDPNRLADLRFETIGHLATFRRMDLIVFFPVGEIRRWLDAKPDVYGPLVSAAVGTDAWRQTVGSGSDAPQLIPVFRRQLAERFGYRLEQTYNTPIRGDGGTVLYHLVFASKHPKADEIWEGVTKRSPDGQRRLF